MSLRTIASAADMTSWLPPEYADSTDWTPEDINRLLTEGADPRLIAAEVWEDYAIALPPAADGGLPGAVTEWTNLDVSVKYAGAASPRERALAIARHHRARAKVKTLRYRHSVVTSNPPEGLEDQ